MNARTTVRWSAVLPLLLAMAWALPAPAAPAKAAKGPQPQPVIDSADQWWLMNAGRTLVVRKGDSLLAGPADRGNPRVIHQAKGLAAAEPVDDATLGFQAEGPTFHTLHVATGKVATQSAAPTKAPVGGPNAFPLADGKGKVVEDNGTIFLEMGATRHKVLRTEGKSRLLPDRAKDTQLLGIEHLVDSNQDGRVDPSTGDRAEIWVLDLTNPSQRIRLADSSQETVTRGWTPDGKHFVLNRVLRPDPGAKTMQGDLMVFTAATQQPMRLQPGPGTNYVSYRGYAGPDELVISFDNFPSGPKQKPISQFALLKLRGEVGLSLIGQAFPSRPDSAVGPGVLIYALKDPKSNVHHLFRVALKSAGNVE